MTKIGEIYRKVHGRFVERPTNFSWVIPQKLAGSGLPSSFDQLTRVYLHEFFARYTQLPHGFLQ